MAENKIHVDPAEILRQQEIMQAICIENKAKSVQQKACVITYGCQQNENDSERIKGMLEKMGYELTDERETADVIIFNTCAVRENAEKKLKGNVGALKYLKAKRPNLVIGVCGCMVQQEQIAKEMFKKFRHISLIFGTHGLYKFPELLRKARANTRVFDVQNIDGEIAEDIPVKRDDKFKAWVTIMYGCNNFCSYCIVPYVRGRERSRNPKDVLDEIKVLAKDGYKEITLLGQNVNSYGNDLKENKMSFAELLRAVNEIDGIERIRFATSHPKDLSDELILAMAECDKVCKQLHLPFQAGSNNTLKAMNRSYTRESYLETVRKIREKMPDIALTSDVIVGFPTETNEDFEETLSLVKEVRFDNLFTFIYSKRKGTVAEKMPFVLSGKEIQVNFDRLVALQNEISREINDTYLGKTLPVLIDGESKTDKSVLQGRTESNKVVNLKGDKSLVGSIQNVNITEIRTWSLNGEL